MYLYANGCSMTYGSELHDDLASGVCTDHDYRWRYSWPGQLRGRLDLDGAYNDAVPSGSNDRIVRTTTEFVARWTRAGLPAGSLLVVIGWSHPARREFFVAGDYRQVVPHHYYDIRALDRLVARYRAAATSAREAADRYATQVAALRALLTQQRVPHLFFSGIAPAELPERLRDSCVEQAFTDGRFLGHGTARPTMVDFLHDRPDTWNVQHPNETGHRMWAERLAGELDPAGFPAIDPDRLAEAGLPVLGGSRVSRRHDRKGAQRLARHLRAHRIHRQIRRTGGSDSFIYP